MTKIQLLEKIEELKRGDVLKTEIIRKLLTDFIMIKPAPKGQIKNRIVIITSPVKTHNLTITGEYVGFFQPLEVKGVFKMKRQNEDAFLAKKNK